MIDESFLIPIPRTEAPLDVPALGWGIIGPGRIASTFVESLAAHTRQRIVAVGSRSIDTALNFAKRFDGCDAVRSYEELVKHPAVDIVYVSTPHSIFPSRSGPSAFLTRSRWRRPARPGCLSRIAVVASGRHAQPRYCRGTIDFHWC
jgi:hypothetical protein